MNDSIRNASVNRKPTIDQPKSTLQRNPPKKLEKAVFEKIDLLPQSLSHSLQPEMPPASVGVKSQFPKALFGGDSDGDAEFQCFFTRIVNSGRPAVLARINVYLGDESAYELSRLLRCITELNVRLPRLKAGVCSDETGRYFLSLHGLSRGQITSDNLSRFLTSVTRDLDAFFAYAKAYGIQVSPERP